ncbi:hypothetical protein PIB30_051474 [Stylosanthes scabra]|uniref:Uncharacterized protein n=1 Tax=Stylosanthes scabra TaxID=79078 RepID=A0ABU6WKN6_9FABA|nr:hypothetical protein [Stylosanthes scabra]
MSFELQLIGKSWNFLVGDSDHDPTNEFEAGEFFALDPIGCAGGVLDNRIRMKLDAAELLGKAVPHLIAYFHPPYKLGGDELGCGGTGLQVRHKVPLHLDEYLSLLVSAIGLGVFRLCVCRLRLSISPQAPILNACLLYEIGKGKVSRWHPYLMHLPKSYDILAMFGEFEKTALQLDESIWVTENPC